jgi:hypothetical protein
MLRHVGEAGVASARRLGPKVCATDGERDAARALRRRVTEVLDDHANESEDRAT